MVGWWRGATGDKLDYSSKRKWEEIQDLGRRECTSLEVECDIKVVIEFLASRVTAKFPPIGSSLKVWLDVTKRSKKKIKP